MEAMNSIHLGWKRFAIWTSENEGDLFVANTVVVTDDFIEFYDDKTDTMTQKKRYKLSDFIRYNEKLFESLALHD